MQTLATILPAISNYAGFPQQEAFVNAKAKWCLVGAASRTGKTFGAGVKFVKTILDRTTYENWDEPKLAWAVAPTHADGIAQKIEILRCLTLPDEVGQALFPLVDWSKQGGKLEFFDTSHGRGTLFLQGGWTIEMKSGERPETLVARKVWVIWCTEIARMKIRVWPNIYSRLANYDDSVFIADTSPLGRCWFYQEVWEPALKGEFKNASTHTWTAVDSPYVSEAAIEEARENLPPEFFRREFMADWSAFQGQVYSQWNRAIHVRPQPFNTRHVVISVDINTTSESPAAFGVFNVGGEYVDPTKTRRERMHLAKEFYEVIGLDYEKYANAIHAEYRRNKAHWPTKVIIDPSAHNEFKRMLETRGIPIYLAKNEVEKGIRTLGGAMVNKAVLGCPLFTVDPSCTNFPGEIEGYAYRVTSAGVVSEEPDKAGRDHLLDCGRYASMEVWSGFSEAMQLK